MSDKVAASASGSPFLDSAPPIWAEPAPGTKGPAREAIRTPFLNEYESLGEDEAESSPFAEVVEEFLAEIRDEEFEGALDALVAELNERFPPVFGEDEDGSRSATLEAAMHQYLAPLAEAAEAYVDRAAEALAGIDSNTANEVEVAQALEALEFPPEAGESPAFEQLFKGLRNKIRKARAFAGKVASFATGGFLIKKLLSAFRPHLRPLLAKVVKVGMDWFPKQHRPLVTQLAQKLGVAVGGSLAGTPPRNGKPGTSNGRASDAADAPVDAGDAQASASTPAAPDPKEAQDEFDMQVAELVFRDDREEGELVHEANVSPITAQDPLGDLDRARARFVKEIVNLEDGESAKPIVENFIPAVLFAAKAAVKIIGEQRVAKALGDLIAKFIAPLLGKDTAPALGRLLAGAGLKVLLRTEVDERTEREAAGETVAAAVEETVRRVAALPEEVLSDREAFEAYAYEAFQHSVAATFPTNLVKPELRETDEIPGAWVFLPRRGPKLYKKYSQIVDRRIPPQMAYRIRGFGGSTLGSFLRDRLRIDPGAPITARVHLYEAIPHTRLSRISANEAVRGLDSAEAGAWNQLQPLTPDAAAMLLGSPRMGREMDEEVHGNTPFIGQRLYFLEVPAAPARPVGQESHVHVAIDLPKKQISVCLYLSEVLAQKMATALRRKTAPAAIVAELRGALAGQLAAVTSNKRNRLIRLRTRRHRRAKGTLLSTVQARLRRTMKRLVAKTALDWAWAHLAKSIAEAAAEIIAKTEGPEDGVRLHLAFQTGDGFQALHNVFRGTPPKDGEWPPKQAPRVVLTVRPGPKHD